MSNPDEIEMDEGWISDAESVIHQHCGSDSSDDSHNDWVHDLAVDLWRTLERVRLRDAIHAHVAHVVVSGNGESVQALGPPEAVGAIREAIAERDRLARWKDEALQVLGAWDLVGVALGSPGALGESRAVAALHAVADLLAEQRRGGRPMSGQDQSPQGLWVDTVRRSGRLLAAAPCVPCSNGRHSICWGDLNAVCPCPACAEWAKRTPFGHPPDEEADR